MNNFWIIKSLKTLGILADMRYIFPARCLLPFIFKIKCAYNKLKITALNMALLFFLSF